MQNTVENFSSERLAEWIGKEVTVEGITGTLTRFDELPNGYCVIHLQGKPQITLLPGGDISLASEDSETVQA